MSLSVQSLHTARQPAPGASAGSSGSYQIRSGDTLGGIAKAHGTTVEALLRANPQIRNPDLIIAGDSLRLPGGGGARTHVVRSGDTLSALAARYNTSVSALAGLNGIRNPDLIHVGDRLRLPGAGSGAPSPQAPAPAPQPAAPAPAGQANWMAIARGERGTSEIAGARDNARIVEYHQTTTLRAKDDETPWCSSFVNWTMEKAGYKGTDSAAAISWKNWGDNVGSLRNAREGDIVVLHRKGAPAHQNHVGFFVRDGNGGVTLLGGNQGNTVKESTYGLNQWEVVAVRRPPGAAVQAPTPAPSAPAPGGSTQRGITEADYQAVARQLGVDVAAIKAVAEVEAAGDGFLPSGKPKILFEAHIFSDQTGGRYDRSHPNLSSPSWNRSLYGAGGEHQWTRFNQAAQLNSDAAMKSASWGRFQIMGFNHKAAGFNTVGEFVDAMKRGEGEHLKAFANFIQSHPSMHNALKRHDWAAFARAYNGPGYAANQYDTKMADAYRRHAAGSPPTAPAPGTGGAQGLRRGMEGEQVAKVQEKLVSLGLLSADAFAQGRGIFGPRTEAAVKQFQGAHGLPATGVVDNATLAKIQQAKPSQPVDNGGGALPSGLHYPLPAQYRTLNRADKAGEGEGHFHSHRSGGRLHKGIDLNAPVGTPVYAVASGRATVQNQPGGAGLYVVVQHRDGRSSLYFHLDTAKMRVGQSFDVQAGQQIGTVGRSGNTPAAGDTHLHFELRNANNVEIDPTRLLGLR